MNNGDWTFNDQEDGNWSNDQFDTKEEAIVAGIEYAQEEQWSNLYVGMVQEIPVISPIDADNIIERTAEKIDEDYGGDYEPGDRFDDSLQCGDSDHLQKLLDEAFYKWVEDRNIKCPCFTIESVEQCTVPDLPEGVE